MLDKIKSLSKQTLIYGTFTIVGRFINFLLVPFYTNVFDPSDYGVFAVVFAYIAFLNVFFSLGLESGYFKFASTLEYGNKSQNFTHPFLAVLLNSAILSFFVYLFSGQLSGLLSTAKDYTLIIKFTSAILFFDAISLVPYAYLRLSNKPGIFAGIKLLNIIINVSLNIILVLIYRLGIEAVFLSNVIASAVSFLLLIPFIIGNLSFTFNKELFRELLHFSIPYIPAGIALNLVQVVSRPIMLYLTDESTVGIFQANFKLGIFMMLIVSMFGYAWNPFFLNHAKDPDAKKIFAKVLTLFVGATSFILIFLTFFIDDLVRIPVPPRGHLIGSKYWIGVFIVPLILFSYQIYGIYVNFMSGIYIEKKTKYLPMITGVGAIVTVISNFILIPLWGLWGAAFATFLSYAAMTIYIYYISNKFYPVDYEWKRVVPVIIVNFIALAIYYLLYYSGIKLSILSESVIVIIFFAAIIYLSGFTKFRSYLKILKS